MLFILCLTILGFQACDQIYYFARSYVQGYLYHAPIKLDKVDNHKIHIAFIKTKDNIISGNTNKELYDRICKENNDMTFYNRRNITKEIVYSTYPEVIKIDVTCDKDFDKEHPAFSSLDNLISFEYISYKKFIMDGYKTYCYGLEGRKYTITLNNEDNIDCLFMGTNGGASIIFKYLPLDLSQDYHITVTLTYADGFQVSDTIKYRFDSF